MSEEIKIQEFTFEMLMQSFAESRKEIKELREAQKESAAKSEKEWAEWKETQRISAAKSEKEWAEWKEAQRIMSAETDKQIKALNKQIGGITKSNGKVAEATIYNSLERDMTFAGIEFDFIDKNKKRHIKRLNLKGEYDVVMYNGDTLAIIEIKYNVEKGDVNELIDKKKVEKFRLLFPEYKGYKILLGIGGGSFESDAEAEANKYGIGIIKVVGDKVEYYTDGIRVY